MAHKKNEMGCFERIALVVTDREPDDAIRALPVGALELRIDRFRDQTPTAIERTLHRRKELGLPLIVTVRNDPAEGGVAGIDEDRKEEIFRLSAPVASLFDIELSSPRRDRLIRLAKEARVSVIVSHHDFEKTPEAAELERIASACREAGADIVKIAAHAASMDDLFRMLDFTRGHRNEPIITISMGPCGGLSRLLFPAAGSLYSYTFLDQPSAPGQIPAPQLVDDFRRYCPAP